MESKSTIDPMTYIDFIKLRMVRTTKLKRLLELKDQSLKIEMLINYRNIKHNNEYRKIVDEIGDLEKKQLFNYSMADEIHINSLATMIQQITTDVDDLIREYASIVPEINQLKSDIDNINKKLPNIVYNNDPPIPEHKKNCSSNTFGLID